MFTKYIIAVVCVSIFSIVSSDDLLQYTNDKRQELFQKQLDLMLGSDIILSDKENRVNKIITDMKNKEVDQGFNNPKYFNVSKHFFEYKDEIKKTALYKLLKEMPKGAVLHAHGTAMLSPDYLLNVTYMNDLYICLEDDDIEFIFSAKFPTTECPTQWQLMRDARYSSGDVEIFDKHIRKYFTLFVGNHQERYSDINSIWSKFDQYFIKTRNLLSYKPVWERYFYDTMKVLREANIMYLELRSVLPGLYDLEGNEYNSVATIDTYKKVADQFVKDFPDFYGAKIIYAPDRLVDSNTMKEYMAKAKEIKNKYPDFLAGFDLVGQEDLGAPLKQFLPELVEARSEIDYFFHAGETNWYGTSTDENLLDAIILNCTRIGHAFALNKYPLLLEEVRKRNIAIEVNVISNNVLKLVEDVRNHPLANYLAQGLPVVLSSDDPGCWESDIITHDFYVAFVGVASKHADLRLLKKLALNSLYYSTYADKEILIQEFHIRWNKFIHKVYHENWV